MENGQDLEESRGYEWWNRGGTQMVHRQSISEVVLSRAVHRRSLELAQS